MQADASLIGLPEMDRIFSRTLTIVVTSLFVTISYKIKVYFCQLYMDLTILNNTEHLINGNRLEMDIPHNFGMVCSKT